MWIFFICERKFLVDFIFFLKDIVLIVVSLILLSSVVGSWKEKNLSGVIFYLFVFVFVVRIFSIVLMLSGLRMLEGVVGGIKVSD